MKEEKATKKVAAMQVPDGSAPDPGPGDCYDRVTETCNRKNPGKDWGDKEYRDCITDGLDWCDINEASQSKLFPILDSQGRFEVVGEVTPAQDSYDSAPG